jgi:protein TonB
MSAGIITWLIGSRSGAGDVKGPGYGSVELKHFAQRYLGRALILAMAFHVAAIGTGWGIAALKRRPESAAPRVVRFRTIADLGAPPPLTRAAEAPQIAIPEPAGPQPSVGVPEPVPDEQVSEQTTIATQQELAEMIPSSPFTGEGSAGDSLVIEGSDDEYLPSPDEFVAVEEMPVLVSMPQPIYPDMARQAELEGVVLVRALVGKDGAVKDAKIAKSIPLLDEEARNAVMKAVFKPAIQANKPVAVWVAIPIRFKLKG